MLFLLVDEGLSRDLREEKNHRTLKGIQISQYLQITHLLFVDDVLIFCSGMVRDSNTIHDILELFSKSTVMEISSRKLTLTTHLLRVEEFQVIRWFFPFNMEGLDVGLKYLGFCLKPNDYQKQDWKWLLDKLEKRLKVWSDQWLTRVGRMELVKAVLEAILVY